MGRARAAEPELEPDPEIVVEEDPAPDPEPEPEKPEKVETVPVAALVEERRKYQSKIDELTGRLDRFQPLAEEIVRLRQERQKPPEERPKPVDYLEDPKGYVDSLNAALVADLKKAQEQIGNAAQTVQQNQLVTAVQSQLNALEAPFTKEHPDYWQALDHLRDSRRSHFKALFPDAADSEIETSVKEEEFRTATLLLQRRQNPIERAYALAQTMGYKPPSKEEDVLKNQDKANAGGLGASSGQSVNSELERMMSSTDDEFDKAFAALFGKR